MSAFAQVVSKGKQDVQTKRVSGINRGWRREELNAVLSQRLVSVAAATVLFSFFFSFFFQNYHTSKLLQYVRVCGTLWAFPLDLFPCDVSLKLCAMVTLHPSLYLAVYLDL